MNFEKLEIKSIFRNYFVWKMKQDNKILIFNNLKAIVQRKVLKVYN